MRKIALAVAVSSLLPLAAAAEVTRIEFAAPQPFGQFNSGKYVRLEGEAFGVLSPKEAIPGLDKAARNGAGLIEYRTPVTLLMPEPMSNGNRALLVDIPNRGRAIGHGLYNSPRSRPIAVGSLDYGIGFLENRGYAIAVVHWELGEGPVFPAFDDKGRKLYAEGVGFAAVRDVALFLKTAPAPGNPLAGGIDRAYAVGYSQTARFVKSFLLNGFNEVDGTMVFDGLHIVNAAAGVIPLLDAGPGPGSIAWDTPGHGNPELRGVHEEPFTWADAMKQAGARYKQLPKIVVNNTYNDYLGGRASLTRTGAKGTELAPIPDNVRLYEISGAPHTMSRGRNKDCSEGQGQLDWSPALRAELVTLDNWVRSRMPPPPSRLFDLEARPQDPQVFQAPRYLHDAVVMVPRLDRDGNAQSGVVLPDVAVPIATHGTMNGPLTTMACRQAGTYHPFAKTAAERQVGNDQRLSLEERYPGGINEYVTRVRLASGKLVSERMLLPEDALIIVHAAAENPSFAPTQPRARGAVATPPR